VHNLGAYTRAPAFREHVCRSPSRRLLVVIIAMGSHTAFSSCESSGPQQRDQELSRPWIHPRQSILIVAVPARGVDSHPASMPSILDAACAPPVHRGGGAHAVRCAGRPAQSDVHSMMKQGWERINSARFRSKVPRYVGFASWIAARDVMFWDAGCDVLGRRWAQPRRRDVHPPAERQARPHRCARTTITRTSARI
jgi:hypothetical protein